MSGLALATMLTAWGIIGFFTIWFFVKILRTPQRKQESQPDKPAS